jgi:hypothetical protein
MECPIQLFTYPALQKPAAFYLSPLKDAPTESFMNRANFGPISALPNQDQEHKIGFTARKPRESDKIRFVVVALVGEGIKTRE